MTVEQVTAIDGPGTLSSSGRYRRITYNQGFKAFASEPGGKTKTAVDVTAYLGFLFVNGRLVAMDVGGGV